MIREILNLLPWRAGVNKTLERHDGELAALRRLFTEQNEDLAENHGGLVGEFSLLADQLRQVRAEVRKIEEWRERLKRTVTS